MRLTEKHINMTKSALHQSYNQIITEQQLARDR